MPFGTTTMEHSREVLQTSKSPAAIWFTIRDSGCIATAIELRISKTHLHSHVEDAIHNSQGAEATCIPHPRMAKWIKKMQHEDACIVVRCDIFLHVSIVEQLNNMHCFTFTYFKNKFIRNKKNVDCTCNGMPFSLVEETMPLAAT
jgi:hypothetical protein